MSEIKVSQLPQADSIQKEDSIMVIQEGANKKANAIIQTTTGKNINIDNSVYDIAEITSNSKNLFNKDTAQSGFFTSATGELTTGDANWLYQYISVKPSTSYVISGITTTQASIGLSEFNSSKVFIQKASNYENVSFTTSSTTYYIGVSVRVAEKDTFQLEEGSTATEYNPYNTEATISSKNLCPYKTKNVGVSSSGVINENQTTAYYGIAEKIPVKPNTTYTINFVGYESVPIGIAVNWAEWDASNTFVRRVANQQNMTFTTGASAYYVVFYLFSNISVTGIEFTEIGKNAQLEEGSTQTNYVKAESKIINLIPQETKQFFTYEDKTNITSNGNITINYNTTDRLLNNSDLEVINTEIEEKTKEIYSTDEVIVGKWINGKPIYRKVFKNINITASATAGTYNYTQVNITNLKIDEVININGNVVNTNGKILPLPYQYESGYRTYINGIITNSDISISNNTTSTLTATIIIEYTKTTD